MEAGRLELRASPSRAPNTTRPLGLEPPPGEPERLGRGVVEPVRVVDEAQQRLLSACSESRLERGERDQEPLLAPSAASPSAPRSAAACGRAARRRPSAGRSSWCSPAKGSSASDSTPAPGEHVHPSARAARVLEQGGLAHARLAAQHQHAAARVARRVEQGADGGALARLLPQHDPTLALGNAGCDPPMRPAARDPEPRMNDRSHPPTALEDARRALAEPLIIGLDNTILNVALPSLQEHFDASGSTLQWIVDSYLLVFAGLLLTMGTLGDRFGRKRALQAGLALFGARASPSSSSRRRRS